MEHLFGVSPLLPPLSPMGWQPETGKDGFASLMLWLHLFFASAAISLLQVHCEEVLQGEEHLDPSVSGPIHVLAKKKDPIAQKLSIFGSLFQFFTVQHWQEVVIHCKTPTKKAAGSKSPLIFFFVKSWTTKAFGLQPLGTDLHCVVSMAIPRRAAQMES